MVLKEITVKNFFSYAKEQTLDLTGNGIINVNAPNGNGKSALLIEALTFALFGKTRSEKIDDCVNRYIGKDCKVSVTFEDNDGTIYKVFRYTKHTDKNNAVLIFKGEKNISSKNVKDTEATIVELFGMPYIAFINSTIFSSELYSNFLSAKNSERLVVFENLLNLKQVTLFYAQVKEILKELEEKEQEIKLELTESSTKATSIQDNLDEYNKQAKAKLLELKAQKEEAQILIDKANETLEELNAIDVVTEKAKLSNTTLKQEYEKQITAKKREIDELKKSVETLTEEEEELIEKYENFDFDANKKKEDKYKEDQETIKTRQAGYEKAKVQMDGSSDKMSSLKGHIESYTKDLEECKKDLEKVAESICPFCGQHMNVEETEKKRKEIETKIKTDEDAISDYQEQYDEEKKNYDSFRETYDMLLGEVNSLKEKLDKDFVADSDVKKEKFLNAKKRKEEIKNKSENTTVKVDILENEIVELERKSSEVEISKYTEEYLNSLEEQIKKQNQIITDNNSKIVAANGAVKSAYDKEYVEKLKNNIEEINKKTEKIEEKLKVVKDDKKHYEFLGECCSNKSGGFKKFFINEMIPIFNEKINQYLPFFFNEMKVEIEFDKDLNDTIKVDGKEVTFSSFSRGQKTRVEIAAAFALFNLSRIFFSNKSGLLIVDELLDNGLDEIGIKAAISILEGFAQDAKVFVVSHNPVVKDNIENVIEIKRDENGFSYIKM